MERSHGYQKEKEKRSIQNTKPIFEAYSFYVCGDLSQVSVAIIRQVCVHYAHSLAARSPNNRQISWLRVQTSHVLPYGGKDNNS